MSTPTGADAELERVNFTISADGRRAGCLAMDARRQAMVQLWTFDEQGGPSVLPVDPARGAPSTVLPLPDGRVLLVRSTTAVDHELVLLTRTGAPFAEERTLGQVRCQKIRIRSCPAPDTLALVVGRDGLSDGAVWRVSAEPPGVERVVTLRDLQLIGGGWLDVDGRRFAVNRRQADGRIRPVAVDIPSGTVLPLAATGRDSNEVLQCTSPKRGLMLLASDCSGEFRFAVEAVDRPASRHFPPGLNSLDGAVLPFGFDHDGRRLALRVSHGVDHRTVVHHLRVDRPETVALPLGTHCGPVRFDVDPDGVEVLRLAYTTPDRPADLITVPLGATSTMSGPEVSAWTTSGSDGSASGAARVERFSGPAGPLEAVVYGHPDWRRAEQVVIALHGGPEQAWRPQFDPLFRDLVRAGATVVAPNQRGSTHYGTAHQTAIRGSWGGPDLEDVCHLARTIVAERRAVNRTLSLYGLSYGAYLALLAASVEPGLWSRCAVVAPFLSGPRLYPVASPGVRRLLDRLDGLTEISDSTGPRDVLRLVSRLTARLLVVHGREDPVVPVDQSRTLRQCLIDQGRREGVDFVYREIADGDHYPRYDDDGNSVRDQIVRVLCSGSLSPDSSPRPSLAPH